MSTYKEGEMKEILDDLKLTQTIITNEEIKLLQDCGCSSSEIKRRKAFNEGFIIITKEKIKQYLINRLYKIGLKNKNKIDWYIGSSFIDAAFRVRTSGWAWNGKTYSALWDEKPLKDCLADYVPPMNILAKLKQIKEKEMFDSFFVATVTVGESKLNDPFLIGKIDNIKDRFFIAQWGDDIKLDDVI